MEYLDGYSTAIRHVVRKVGLYDLEMISLWDVISEQVDLHMTDLQNGSKAKSIIN